MVAMWWDLRHREGMEEEQRMSRRTVFSVKLRRPTTGEEQVRTIFAADESTANRESNRKSPRSPSKNGGAEI
jgi:hypothetical protein